MDNQYKQAIEEYRQAEQMLNYADTNERVEVAVNLMHIANQKIKQYKSLEKINFVHTPESERELKWYRAVSEWYLKPFRKEFMNDCK